MATVIRRRNSVVAAKTETVTGLDAFGGSAPSASTDFLKSDIAVAYNQTAVTNPELTYSLDEASTITGGTKVQITLTIPLKGSGAAGVPPQWGKLMTYCSYLEQIETPGHTVPAAATAGSVSSVTLGSGYTVGGQTYRGMPILLTGNPAVAVSSIITDYTGSVATLAHTFATTLDTTTMVAVPPNVTYKPTSDTTLQKTGTLAIYMDGLAHRFTGCAGTWKISADAGGIGTITFTFTGQYAAPISALAPTGIAFDATEPPVFRQGVARLDGGLARIKTAMFDTGAKLYEPENPEAIEGFDPSIITSRVPVGSFDPLMDVTSTIARMAAFKSGSRQRAAISLGTVAGNRVGVMSPVAKYTAIAPTNRNDLMSDAITFSCASPDAGIFLTVF